MRQIQINRLRPLPKLTFEGQLPNRLQINPKLTFEGQLERSGVGGIFAVSKQTAAVKDLEELLDRCAPLFGNHPVDGCAMEPVDVRLKDPDKVVWVPPRRLSQREEQIVDLGVDELLKMGAITRSTSPFNTPIVVVEQKGKSRVCFDFRELTKHVENSHYPLPRIREMLQRLHGVTFFWTLDLARGYHQLSVTSSNRRLLTFSTQKGKYE
jgi:hypothetical protein